MELKLIQGVLQLSFPFYKRNVCHSLRTDFIIGLINTTNRETLNFSPFPYTPYFCY